MGLIINVAWGFIIIALLAFILNFILILFKKVNKGTFKFIHDIISIVFVFGMLIALVATTGSIYEAYTR